MAFGTKAECGKSQIQGYFSVNTTETKEFILSVQANGGYYIGRYEARTADGQRGSKDKGVQAVDQVTCKSTDYIYNYINYPDALRISKGMYSNTTFTSNLVNSYAWDSALYFFEKVADADYSQKTGYQEGNTENGKVGFSWTGTIDTANVDKICNVYDMASNSYEWSTEIASNSTDGVMGTVRGGVYSENRVAGARDGCPLDGEQYHTQTFRVILYMDYPKVAEGWLVTKTPTSWTKADGTINDKLIAITDGTNIVPLPNGYQVSQDEGETTISEGLVITDGENEFVWIPIATSATFANPYYAEPSTLDSDTDEYLNAIYGENYYTMANDFNYSAHYEEMIASVEKYDGFYIGRYETTIEGTKVGSKENATVLTYDKILNEVDGTTYSYRWWGLYDSQRKANVKGNGNIVQTNMIWGQQWDAVLAFFRNQLKDYSESTVKILAAERRKQNAGQAKYTYNNKTISDKICNIYDLRGNVQDWTAYTTASNASGRISRGGSFDEIRSAAHYYGFDPSFVIPDGLIGSRLTLYIK